MTYTGMDVDASRVESAKTMLRLLRRVQAGEVWECRCGNCPEPRGTCYCEGDC